MRRASGRARAAELRFYKHAVEEAEEGEEVLEAESGAGTVRVVVEIQRARGLMSVDKKGEAHPFCSLQLVELRTGRALAAPHAKSVRTRVCKGTTHPTWEATKERFG